MRPSSSPLPRPRHRRTPRHIEIGRVQLRTTVPLLCDPYSKNRTSGSFILHRLECEVPSGDHDSQRRSHNRVGLQHHVHLRFRLRRRHAGDSATGWTKTLSGNSITYTRLASFPLAAGQTLAFTTDANTGSFSILNIDATLAATGWSGQTLDDTRIS